MTNPNPKTKRDRAAGRAHRHTAIKTIIDNHDQVRTDIDSLDNSVACLQDELCEARRLTDHLNGRVEQHAKDTNANVGFAMQCIVENERKLTETETAVGILQGAGKDQRTALAQLDRYTKKLHAKQTNLNRELNLTRAAVDEVRDDLMWFGRLLIGVSASAILAYIILFLIVIVR
nr:MAG TPA: hemolysin XhlA [Caudoviricetes sp.]